MNKKIFQRAFDECMEEMYNKSFPSASWKEYIEKYNSGEIGKNDHIYERHYLSREEFNYILDKYVHLYGLEEKWKPYCDIILDDLKNGYSSDKYVEPYIDEHEFKHPGYRSYQKIKSLKDQIESLLSEYSASDIIIGISEEINDLVIKNIENRKDFYRFDRDESDFRCNVALGASPTSNLETVKSYWKEQGIDIGEPKWKNPLLFWEMDEYGEDFEEIMKEDYGDDWETIWKEKWEKKQEEKEKELEENNKKLDN